MDQAKKSYPLVLWPKAPHQKVTVVGLLFIPEKADHGVLSLDHKKGEVNLRHCPKSTHNMLVVSDW